MWTVGRACRRVRVVVAVPGVSVFDERAKVGYDAAICSVDEKQVGTLISHGLDESEAVDVIVRGLLK
jgi:Fe-S cluster assembly scaffold protein SufB